MELFNRTMKTAKGHTKIWSVKDDGSDLLKGESVDLSEKVDSQ